MNNFSLKHIDWLLLAFIAPVIGAGLITMKSFLPDVDGVGSGAAFFSQQLTWVVISL